MKVINAERAALQSPEFKKKELRTRRINLNEFVKTYNLAKYRVSATSKLVRFDYIYFMKLILTRMAKESMSSFKLDLSTPLSNQLKSISELANQGVALLMRKEGSDEEVKKVLEQVRLRETSFNM